MNYTQFKKEEIAEIDIHNMSNFEAQRCLDFFIETLPKEIKEIIVIHGYHNGTKLLELIRYSYNNKRVKKKFLSLNRGITHLILV